MQTKFNFYDFIGYIIPGSFVLFLLYWFAIAGLCIPIEIEFKSFGESVIFLIAAYFFGNITQAIGNSIESRAVKKWGGWFSEQYLRPDNTFYSPEFKKALNEALRKVFSLAENATTDEKILKNKRQEYFNLAYSLIVQENAALHTEIFNGIYSLYRGMLAAVWIGIIVNGIVIIKNLALWYWSSTKFPESVFFVFDENNLEYSALFLVFLILVVNPLKSRFRRFGGHFANSVYRNFYAWYRRNALKSKKG